MSSRSRALALLGMAAVCAGLSSSIVSGYAKGVRGQVGPLTPVLVVRAAVPQGKLFTGANVSKYLAARRVPVRFVPPRSLRFASDAVGLRSLVSISAGSYLNEGLLGASSGTPARSGGLQAERVVQVTVAGADGFESVFRPGVDVDVLITSERSQGSPRTYLALQHVELADFRPSGSGDASTDAQKSVASLRVTLRQAVLLTAAQNFAREVRLVPRPPADHRRVPPTAVSANDLHP